jgi:hypothetical protein
MTLDDSTHFRVWFEFRTEIQQKSSQIFVKLAPLVAQIMQGDRAAYVKKNNFKIDVNL